MQVPTLEQHEAQAALLAHVLERIARIEAALPEWLRDTEAQELTGLSQATLARERKKPGTLLVWKTDGGLRYLRSSLTDFNEARLTRRAPFAQAA